MIDKKYVMYAVGDKWFDTYDKAYFYRKNYRISYPVLYVFTPTEKLYKRVSELETAFKNYFDCDYFDGTNFYTQLDMKGLLL